LAIVTILSDPKTYDFAPMKSMVLRRLLGLPDHIMRVVDRDNSGVSTKALPGTNVLPSKRFNYLERKATLDFTRASSHSTFVQHFKEYLYDWVDNCEISYE